MGSRVKYSNSWFSFNGCMFRQSIIPAKDNMKWRDQNFPCKPSLMCSLCLRDYCTLPLTMKTQHPPPPRPKTTPPHGSSDSIRLSPTQDCFGQPALLGLRERIGWTCGQATACDTGLEIMFLRRYCELALVEPDTTGASLSCGALSKGHLTLQVTSFLIPGCGDSSASVLSRSTS